MKLGIIIINYNQYEDTIKCVESIFKNCHLNYTIFIVDNGSTNNSVVKLKEKYENINHVVLEVTKKNNGYSAGCNIGLAKAIKEKCDLFLISNNDVYYKKDSIEKICVIFHTKENVGIVGPAILDNEDLIQRSLKEPLTFYKYIFSKKPLRYFDFGGIKKKLYYLSYDYKKKIEFSGMVSGCCFMLSYELFKEIGYFDENIFLYFEEDAIARKIMKTKYKVFIEPDSKVIHFGSKSIGSQKNIFSYYHRYNSSMYVLKKYCDITKLQLTYVFLINYISLAMKTKSDENERNGYCKKLLENYQKLLK